MDRIIRVQVNGNHLTKDSGRAGVRGESNATALRLEFDSGWDGIAKKVTFWDATMSNPVERTLTADLLEDFKTSTRVYLCPIPGEAMTECGLLTFVIDGWVDGKRQRSLSDELEVDDAPIADFAGEPADPTPTQAEQLQGEIESLLGNVQSIANRAAVALEDGIARAEAASEEAIACAETAAESERAAGEYATKAQDAEYGAEVAMRAAETAQYAAQKDADRAKREADRAKAISGGDFAVMADIELHNADPNAHAGNMNAASILLNDNTLKTKFGLQGNPSVRDALGVAVSPLTQYYTTGSNMSADDLLDPVALIPVSANVNGGLFACVGGTFAYVWTTFYSSVSKESRRAQIACSYNSVPHRMALRNYSSNGWAEWREIAMTDKTVAWPKTVISTGTIAEWATQQTTPTSTAVSPNVGGMPDDGAYWFVRLDIEANGNWRKLTATGVSTDVPVYEQTCVNGTWSGWVKQYSSANKPTTAEIGAATTKTIIVTLDSASFSAATNGYYRATVWSEEFEDLEDHDLSVDIETGADMAANELYEQEFAKVKHITKSGIHDIDFYAVGVPSIDIPIQIKVVK